MRQRGRWRDAGVLALILVGLAGCQPAGRFRPAVPATGESQPTGSRAETPASPLDPDLVWKLPRAGWADEDVPIRLVHPASHPDEWQQLPLTWVPPVRPAQVGLLLGTPAGLLRWLGDGSSAPVARLKVPLGLPDPSGQIPAGNPLGLGKWQLGKRIFFDRTLLRSDLNQSCADCHIPDRGFADGIRQHGGFNAPSLVGCVFLPRVFWDGRAHYLEEVIQRTPDDEGEEKATDTFRHSWGGVVRRLRQSATYRQEFRRVLGCEPTQDALAKVVATYLRTLLAGDSLFDRALEAQRHKGAGTLEAAHFEQALRDQDLSRLGRPKADPRAVSGELHLGYRLFHGKEPDRKVSCVTCHAGPLFSDGEFHNLGVGPIAEPWHNAGRFTRVPIGLKQARLIGAYRTPTLRQLGRTAPYLHTGELDTLEAAIRFHDREEGWNPFLDPELLDPARPTRRLPWQLTDGEVAALALFLRALDGEPVDAALASPPRD